MEQWMRKCLVISFSQEWLTNIYCNLEWTPEFKKNYCENKEGQKCGKENKETKKQRKDLDK